VTQFLSRNKTSLVVRRSKGTEKTFAAGRVVDSALRRTGYREQHPRLNERVESEESKNDFFDRSVIARPVFRSVRFCSSPSVDRRSNSARRLAPRVPLSERRTQLVSLVNPDLAADRWHRLMENWNRASAIPDWRCCFAAGRAAACLGPRQQFDRGRRNCQRDYGSQSRASPFRNPPSTVGTTSTSSYVGDAE
jgi:hypothetical protein